ncbi:MAG: RNA methyltransferase [Deltaproteobacteria bacterium]|nr:RNA methyltransferase [Deltaproteobacteria bacterium]
MTRHAAQRGESEIIVFGRHPVRDAIRSDGVEVLEVKIARGASGEDRRALRELTERADIPVEEVARDALSRYSGASRHDQGIAAKVRLLRVMGVDAFLDGRKGRGARRPTRVIGLDGVTNSQNVGMVVRSVVAAGLDGLVWPLAGQPWVNGLVVRAAAGSIFECPILCCESLTVGLAALQGAGFACIGLDAGAEDSLFEDVPPHRAVYLLGSESQGLSQEVRAQLDRRVSIPIVGRLESLNVAVAAGLVCFHAAGLLTERS